MDDSPLVEFIASRPGMAERLLAEHVDDGSGHCPACPLGGQKGYQCWPCNLHYYATRASEVGRAVDDVLVSLLPADLTPLREPVP